jgi:hypothetical protein
MKKQLFGLVLVGAMIIGPLSMSASAASDPVVQVQTSAAVDLSQTGGVQTQVESVALSAGSWTITSNLSAIDFGSGDFVRCHLQSDTTDIDGGATIFLANRVADIVNAGTVVNTKKATIALFCDHDKNAASSNQFYIDPGATITAVEGGPIEGPGQSLSKPTVVEARSTANTPLNENTFGPVTSVILPKGNWALQGNGSDVNFGDFDFGACEIDTTAGSIDDNNWGEAGTDGTDAAAADIDVLATAKIPAGGATVNFDCESEFTSSTYIDAGATLTATKTAATDIDLPGVAISDSGGTLTTVATEAMPAGAWRVNSNAAIGFENPNNSWGGSGDFVRCELLAGKHVLGSAQTQELTTNANIQTIVNSGTYTSTKSWTLKEACSHDHLNTEPGHYTVFSGNLVGVNQGPIG